MLYLPTFNCRIQSFKGKTFTFILQTPITTGVKGKAQASKLWKDLACTVYEKIDITVFVVKKHFYYFPWIQAEDKIKCDLVNIFNNHTTWSNKNLLRNSTFSLNIPTAESTDHFKNHHDTVFTQGVSNFLPRQLQTSTCGHSGKFRLFMYLFIEGL